LIASKVLSGIKILDSLSSMAGIHLYSSNRLEILADTFADLVQAQPIPPLQKEIILVQS
ncbi:MAG: exodeoxyribonuclease V subunit gamma, partial [candidate division Zixibacteria bacterium]|nr:exodeoxyribonuclease V subunit gamma [candidate division Zixibacteria bacterium]NIW39502.1 hypothetical protein [candidate division Zixibacteria bacterium]